MAKSNTPKSVNGKCVVVLGDWVCLDDATARTSYCEYHRQQQWAEEGFSPRVQVRTRDVRIRNEEGQKRCIRCNLWIPEEGFYGSKHTSDKLQPHCKECTRVRRLELQYGITGAQYEEMLVQQKGACAICRTLPAGKRLAVDHDHSCCPGGKSCGRCVRGLLCESCNKGLGLFRDDVSRMNSAISYVKEYMNE